MAESYKEKDEKFVKQTVDLLVMQSNLKPGYKPPVDCLREDSRVTVTLSKDDIRRKTERTVVRGDALNNIATQFQQYGCTTVVLKDKIKVTGPVEQSREMTFGELEDSVKKGLASEDEGREFVFH